MKLISASFFTTLSWQQSFRALLYLFFGVKAGRVEELEKEVSKLVGLKYSRAFYNCRSALYHGLKASGIKEGDEIIIQAYTCVSVVNSIKALGAKPVYVDIKKEDLNINPDLVEAKISGRTKAIIVQHNFGLPADLDKIGEIAVRHGLFLVEDCAHALGAKIGNKLVGSNGKFSVFSFGRDKVISGVNGGVLATDDQSLFAKLPELSLPSKALIKKNLLYPLIANLSRTTYYFLSLGKVIIALSRKLKLIPEVTSAKENNCQDLQILNYAMPEALAGLILNELKNLNKVNQHRRKLADLYASNLKKVKFVYPRQADNFNIFLRFVILTERKKEIYLKFKKQGVILGDWYDQAVAPKKASLTQADYTLGSCPIAEEMARLTLNLPNHQGVTKSVAEKIIKLLNE